VGEVVGSGAVSVETEFRGDADGEAGEGPDIVPSTVSSSTYLQTNGLDVAL